jgi:hypothetical protein
MFQSCCFPNGSVGTLGGYSTIFVLDVSIAVVRAEGKTGWFENFLGMNDCITQGICRGVLKTRNLLGTELYDVSVEPNAPELWFSHVLCAWDATATGRCPTKTVEGLSHVPFGRRVEECKLISDFETFGANKNVQVSYIEEKTRFTRMVDVQQIAVKVEVGIATGLNSSICGFASRCARWEVELCKYSEGWERYTRDALGGEFLCIYDNNFLDVGVRGLMPVGSERSHCDGLGQQWNFKVEFEITGQVSQIEEYEICWEKHTIEVSMRKRWTTVIKRWLWGSDG